MALTDHEYIKSIVSTIKNGNKYYIHKNRITRQLLKELNKIKGGIRIETFIDGFMVIYK